MKKILLALLLLVGALRADEPAHTGGCPQPISSAYTYTLASSGMGVTSTALDVSATAVVYFSSTGTASTSMKYEWSADGTNFSGGSTVAHGNYCLLKRGRYLHFVGIGNVNGTVSARYALAFPSVNTVYVDPSGGLATSALQQAMTTQMTTLTSTISQGLTATASMHGYDVSASWSTFTAQIYGTFTAGVNGPYNICFAPSFGGAGIRARAVSATVAPSDLYQTGATIPTTTTGGVCYGPIAPGTYYAVIGYGAATVSGTVGAFSLY